MSGVLSVHDVLETAPFHCDGGGANQQLGAAWALAPEKARDALEYAFNVGMSVCESDIEKRILPWLLFACAQYSDWKPLLLLFVELHLLGEGKMAIVPQCEFGKYRVDFAIAGRRKGPIKFVVVECDGREFHSTSQQIRDDKKRARTIKSNPTVIGFERLTGSQIWRDAHGYAELIARNTLLAWRGLE